LTSNFALVILEMKMKIRFPERNIIIIIEPLSGKG